MARRRRDDDPTRELFGVAPGDFVAARDRLARSLRADGDPDAAAAVAALRKPNAAVWAVNQLARRSGGPFADLLAAADRLRATHRAPGSGGPGKLREASGALQKALSATLRAAEEVLASGGFRGGNHLDRVREILQAVPAAPDADRDRLRSGTLTAAIEPADLSVLLGTLRPGGRRPAAAKPATPRDADEASSRGASRGDDEAPARRARRGDDEAPTRRARRDEDRADVTPRRAATRKQRAAATRDAKAKARRAADTARRETKQRREAAARVRKADQARRAAARRARDAARIAARTAGTRAARAEATALKLRRAADRAEAAAREAVRRAEAAERAAQAAQARAEAAVDRLTDAEAALEHATERAADR